MRGKTLLIILFSLVLVCLNGCGGREYSFKETIDEIESIEIVWAENSLEFTVIKTLSEEEKSDFVEKLQTIKFYSYFVGDPMSVNGNTVKITYQSGVYEMICYYWAEYVKDGEIYFVRKSCDEEEFNALLNSFLE